MVLKLTDVLLPCGDYHWQRTIVLYFTIVVMKLCMAITCQYLDLT